MNHTASNFRRLDRDRARRGWTGDLQLLAYDAKTGYWSRVAISQGWSAKRVNRFTLGAEFFEIRIAEYSNAASALSAPTIDAISAETGGALGDGSYRVRVIGVAINGRTEASSEQTQTIAGDPARTIRVPIQQLTDALAYDVYVSVDSNPKWIARISEAQRAAGAAIDRSRIIVAGGVPGAIDVQIAGSGLAFNSSDLTPIFDSKLSHALVGGRYHKFDHAIEPKRATRVWIVRTSPTGERKATP